MKLNAKLHTDEQRLAAKFGASIQTGGGTTVQADWAQNDSTAVDFVKNRPGGYYGDLVTVDEEVYSGTIEEAAAEMEVDWLLVAGQTYTVTIGETEKTYTAFADAYDGISGVTIGDAPFAEAYESGGMFALLTVEDEQGKGALILCLEADVGKTIRITTETQTRVVHKIPTELLDLGGVDESIKQTNAALDELGNQHTSDISAINKTLTEGPIVFWNAKKTASITLGKYADGGWQIRWDANDGSYTWVNCDGLYVNDVTAKTRISMNPLNIAITETEHNSGIRFTLEKSDSNGGTRFSVENVAGVRTTFYASGKIVNSNKLLQLSASSTITEDNATTLRGVKTPEQDFDAANKKYVDQRLPTLKTLKWITVHSADLTETKSEYVVSADADGKSIADYEPIMLSLIIFTPADSTQENTNGSPWVYPSATISDNAIRVIGTIAGWKTIARDSAFIFSGNSSAMSCTGNVNTSLATYKVDGYSLNGVKIFFNTNSGHLPIGTHIEVAIMCEVDAQ